MSCGDGWFKLIDQMCYDVIKLIDDKNIEVIATQVKEKFGGLRFYYSLIDNDSPFLKLKLLIQSIMFSNKLVRAVCRNRYFRRKFWKTTSEKISDRIDKAERDSYKICETCGEPGNIRGGSWMKTTCDSCQKKFDEGKRPWQDEWDNPKSLTIYELMFGED